MCVMKRRQRPHLHSIFPSVCEIFENEAPNSSSINMIWSMKYLNFAKNCPSACFVTISYDACPCAISAMFSSMFARTLFEQKKKDDYAQQNVKDEG